MKTITSNKTEEALEVAKRILYSLKVVTIGLFIPFLFIFGITNNTPKHTPKDEINFSKPYQVTNDRIALDFDKPLSDQNS